MSLAPIIRAWRMGQYELVISDHILDEIRSTLTNPYFSRSVNPSDVQTTLTFLSRFATVVEITVTVEGVATHPEDDLILATAVSGQVDYLVTADRQLLGLGEYDGVRIVSPREFLAILDAEAD